MAIHDAYARVTPYELLLPKEGFAEDRFPRIRQEAEGRGGSLDNPDSFILLGEAALALREVRGEDDPAEAVQQHGALLFQGFHFWEQGQPLFLLETDVVRFLVENGPEEGEWAPNLPADAGYLQLPQHMVWAGSSVGGPPESLDGLFWAAPNGENVTFLIVMGMRKDRPGLSVVPLPTLPLAAAVPWASMTVRPDGNDFRSSLPGAELEGLYAIEAGGEAVKLAMRIFWYLDVFPGRIGVGEDPADGPEAGHPDGGKVGAEADAEGGGSASPRPSILPYRRVILGQSRGWS